MYYNHKIVYNEFQNILKEEVQEISQKNIHYLNTQPRFKLNKFYQDQITCIKWESFIEILKEQIFSQRNKELSKWLISWQQSDQMKIIKVFRQAGTPYWMAPQIIESKGEISTSCDIWSLGCTVIQLLTGNPPYFDLMQYSALFLIVQDQHPPLPQVSPQCKQFLLKCFKKQPELRLTVSQLMKQTWLDN